MKAVVVYESLWGNTAEIAHAIAEGIGVGVPALSTALAVGETMDGVDLIVAGSPVLGFSLPTEQMREGIRANPAGAPSPPDLSHPSLRSWLDALPPGTGRSAAFETRAKGPWGAAKPAIDKALSAKGYPSLIKPEGFIVTGKFGPLKAGEVERARAWGAAIASAAASAGL